jgi:hypothetical protein
VPREVHDDEVVIRAVTTWNVKAGALQRNLFTNNSDDAISVSRRRWIAPWLAKFIAKLRIENRQLKPPKTYVGLAYVSARVVRECGSEIVDSREEYLGHADIVHGVGPQPRGVPLPAATAKRINKRADAIRRVARFVPDPNPKSLIWSGDDP